MARTKKPKWAKKLTASEFDHVKEIGTTGRASFQRLKDHLAKSHDTCMECRHMGYKLGIKF